MMREPHAPVSGFRWWILNTFLSASMILVVVQSALAAVYLFGDIGFDHGRFGLDFDALIVIAVLYVLALLAGLACSLNEKNWLTALLQLGLIFSVYAYENRPYPRYEAAAYQHLKGMSRAEVEGMLGTRWLTTSLEGHPDGDREFLHYNGMTVIFSPQGRVMRVDSD
jgi:hypothetical protein